MIKRNICLIGASCSGKTTLAENLCKELDMSHVTISTATNGFMESGSPKLADVGNQILQSGLNDPDIKGFMQEILAKNFKDTAEVVKYLFQKGATFPDPLVEQALRHKLTELIESGKMGNGSVVDNIMSAKHHKLTSEVLKDTTGKPLTHNFYLHADGKTILERADMNIKMNPNNNKVLERYNPERIQNRLQFFEITTMPMVRELESNVHWLDANQNKKAVTQQALDVLSK